MRTGYCAIVPQTHEEKMEMYMRLSKEELAEMLINANDIIEKHLQPKFIDNDSNGTSYSATTSK